MSELMPNMSQGEVRARFDKIFSSGVSVLETRVPHDEWISPGEFYDHLKAVGYSDEEVEMMFDLVTTEEEIREI